METAIREVIKASKYNFEWNENDYKTPPVLYEKALEHWGLDKFDLDTCCTVENIPAYRYYKFWLNDGLSEDWEMFNWCNPPFNECRKWIAKAYLESQKGNKTAMLIPVRTETAYWHEYILHNPDVKIEWLRKGYKFFNRDNEEMGVFKNALAIVYFEGVKQA